MLMMTHSAEAIDSSATNSLSLEIACVKCEPSLFSISHTLIVLIGHLFRSQLRFRLFWRLPLHYRKCGGKSFGQFIVCPESSEFAQHTGVCHLCQTCVPQCARQLEWLGGTHLFVWWRQQWSFCYNQADDQTFNDVLRRWTHVFINFTIKVVINPPAAKPECKYAAALVMMINDGDDGDDDDDAGWWSLTSRMRWYDLNVRTVR